MDIVTQSLLGGVMAQLVARKEEKKRATAIGLFSGLLADAGCDLYDLFVTFYSPGYSIIQIPSGWDSMDGWDGSAGEGFITAYSLNPGAPPVGTDVAPGGSLGGFIFQFDYQAGNLPFDVTLFNPSPPYDPIVISSTTAPVPEPGTLLLLSLGLFMVVGCKKRRKGNQVL